jgi:hypothetical protein
MSRRVAVNPKSLPGPRPPTMQEQTIARVRQQRDELIRLKRQGGGGALRAALNVIIGNVAGEAGSEAGGAGQGYAAAAGGGGGGGGGGAAPPALHQQQLLPQWQRERLEQQQQQQHYCGASTPADGLEDCFDALSPEEHVDLLLRLQAVLEEEELAEAAALAGEQLEEHERRECAEIEYLASQYASEERADSSGPGGSMGELEE